MKYTDFVKEQMRNPKLQGMKQTEKMSMIAKMWRSSGHSKSMGKGMCPTHTGKGIHKTKGNGLVGDILGEMAEGFTRSKTLGSKIKGGIKF